MWDCVRILRHYPQGRTAYCKNIFVLGYCLGSDRAAGVTVGVSRRPSMLCGGEREVMYITEFDSWLQPTTADDYMQRLSVLYRRRKTAKVQGIVKRALLAGWAVDGSDHIQR